MCARARARERERERDRQTDRKTDRQTQTDTDRQTETDRQTDRQRETHTHTHTEPVLWLPVMRTVQSTMVILTRLLNNKTVFLIENEDERLPELCYSRQLTYRCYEVIKHVLQISSELLNKIA